MKEVFISYKSEEVDEATWVKSVLENNGISCWMAPACIPGGSSYAVEIPQAIKKAKVFVLILSSKAQSSQWVSREVDCAINAGKIILPFMLENCALKDDFNFYLTNVQRYTAYENKLAAAEKMVTEIKAIVGSNETNTFVKTPNENINMTKENTVAEPNEDFSDFSTEQTAKTYDMKCIWSFVFGIISLDLLLFGIPAIMGFLLADLGLTSATNNNKKGKGFAIAGQVLCACSAILSCALYFSVVGLSVGLVISTVSTVKFVIKYRKLKG